MTTAIEKLDELLAIIRNRMIEVKGLQEKEVDETDEEEFEQSEQEELPQYPDTDYLIKVFNHLKELGYINTQDALHYLIKSISELSETETNSQRLDDLYEEGHSLITKRLLKNY